MTCKKIVNVIFSRQPLYSWAATVVIVSESRSGHGFWHIDGLYTFWDCWNENRFVQMVKNTYTSRVISVFGINETSSCWPICVEKQRRNIFNLPHFGQMLAGLVGDRATLHGQVGQSIGQQHAQLLHGNVVDVDARTQTNRMQMLAVFWKIVWNSANVCGIEYFQRLPAGGCMYGGLVIMTLRSQKTCELSIFLYYIF